MKPHSLRQNAWPAAFVSSALLILIAIAIYAPFLVDRSQGSQPFSFSLAASTVVAHAKRHEDSRSRSYDVIIYGSTPAALTAALQVRRMNRTAAIVSPENRLGGLTISGLGWTDSKDGSAIGGIAREFYGRIFSYYNSSSAWTRETREGFVRRNIAAQPGPAIQAGSEVQWIFEPHAAEQVINAWVEEEDVQVFFNQPLIRNGSGIAKAGSAIASISTESGETFSASMFIDAGYEGDLMAAAGVPYVIGRDAKSLYKEPMAGIFIRNDSSYLGVDPYVKKDLPDSGLLDGIEQVLSDSVAPSINGTADYLRLQSFNWRLCLTKASDNKVAFSKPDGYNVSDFELLLRWHEAGKTQTFINQPMPNIKTDSNSAGPFSFDWIGGNFNYTSNMSYSELSYDDRAIMVAQHKVYQRGLLWTLSNNSRIPEATRNAVNAWGLAKDEFTSNENWPYQLYIREARRMQGLYTLTQMDVQNASSVYNDTIIGMGSYNIDSHVVRRVVINGQIYNEGNLAVPNTTPYPIPYGVIVPDEGGVTNLLNPITLSASHVAFGSVRMEPTYMILGQSAATAAVLAIQQQKSVQEVDRSTLKSRLKSDLQVLFL